MPRACHETAGPREIAVTRRTPMRDLAPPGIAIPLAGVPPVEVEPVRQGGERRPCQAVTARRLTARSPARRGVVCRLLFDPP